MKAIILSVLFAALLIVGAASVTRASTVSVPVNGKIEIVGDIPSPVSVTAHYDFLFVGFIGVVVESGEIELSGNIAGPFSRFQTCIGSFCGFYSGYFAYCGNGGVPGGPGCSDQREAGTVEGVTVTFNVSDTSRFLLIQNVALL